MKHKDKLLQRLDSIAHGISLTPGGLGLLGLGSVGQELERIDEYSDLDFFAIVAEDSKESFLNNLGWLELDAKLSYMFRNTKDGYKFLYTDGIYGEMAVFTLAEFEHIPFSPGRVVWKTDQVEIPVKSKLSLPSNNIDEMYEVNELLTNLLVGLLRQQRGEQLSAQVYIQRYALDRLLRLIRHKEDTAGFDIDAFSIERRIEKHHPNLVTLLKVMSSGYEYNVNAAEAILNEVVRRWDYNEAIVNEVQLQIQKARK